MAVGEKVYIADKATQDEINQNVDGIVSNIGTTTDSGATSTTGTLMGKVNELLERISVIEENNKFYYFSTTERDVVLDQQYSTKYSSGAGAVLLGKWFAQRTGVIVIQFAAKSASAVDTDKLRFFVYNLKHNCDGYSDSESPTNAGTDASLFDMPAGSSVTVGTPDFNGCALANINISSSSYKTRKYALHVSKGDTLFFVLGNKSSAGDPGYCNHVGIAYADSEESA